MSIEVTRIEKSRRGHGDRVFFTDGMVERLQHVARNGIEYAKALTKFTKPQKVVTKAPAPKAEKPAPKAVKAKSKATKAIK